MWLFNWWHSNQRPLACITGTPISHRGFPDGDNRSWSHITCYCLATFKRWQPTLLFMLHCYNHTWYITVKIMLHLDGLLYFINIATGLLIMDCMVHITILLWKGVYTVYTASTIPYQASHLNGTCMSVLCLQAYQSVLCFMGWLQPLLWGWHNDTGDISLPVFCLWHHTSHILPLPPLSGSAAVAPWVCLPGVLPW